jgi:nucleoside 2-deoxyribosyltransferase
MNNRYVYVAGPYSAPTKEERQKNVKKAEEAGKMLLTLGYVPIIPHKITSHWDEDERFLDFGSSDWLERFCFPLLDLCDRVYMVEGWQESKGALAEYGYALAKDKKIYQHPNRPLSYSMLVL